ncbi:MAG: hypothetical protein IK070_02455 [Clostridia bacterium]|nr:hypothetical protein [Clostridia bacterium]
MTLPKLVNGLSWFMGADDGRESTWFTKIVQPIIDLMNTIIVPLLIVLGTAGTIYAIILGVNFARAESSDKREEAKKRIINFVIGFVVTIVLLVLLLLFVKFAPAIWGEAKDYVNGITS